MDVLTIGIFSGKIFNDDVVNYRDDVAVLVAYCYLGLMGRLMCSMNIRGLLLQMF